MQRDYIIIIGAMKSGTTTLFDVLAQHPAIAPGSVKEPGFFAFPEVWERGFDWFDTLFDFDPDKHRYRLEASTDYTKVPFVDGVWDRMTQTPGVSVKLLYIMRHPLRRLESHARHVQTAGREIGLQPCVQNDHSLDAGLSLLNLVTSNYARQLDTYGEAMEAGLLHCLTLEDLRDHPEDTLARLYDFLGLEKVFPVENELPTSNPAGDRTRPGKLWKHAARMAPLIATGKLLLPKGVRKSIKMRLRETVTAQGRFKLTEAEEAALIAQYASDLERLRDVYGIDPAEKWGIALPPPHRLSETLRRAWPGANRV